MGALVKAFADGSGNAVAQRLDRALETALTVAHAEGQAAWPDLALSPAALAEHLGRVLPEAAEDPALLAGRRVTDLFLVASCLARVTRAAEQLDALLAPPLERQLAALSLKADDAAEVRQRLRLRLLVGNEEGPALLRYTGEGDLRTWVRVVATRLALDHVRRARPEKEDLVPDETLAQVAGLAPALEARVVSRERRALLLQALGEALAGLPARDRALLRLHFLDGASIDALAPTYGVHRATVARWLTAAQERLSSALEATLAARGLDEAERAQALSGTISHLGVSLRDVFRE